MKFITVQVPAVLMEGELLEILRASTNSLCIASAGNFVFLKSKESFRTKDAQRQKKVVALVVCVRAMFHF